MQMRLVEMLWLLQKLLEEEQAEVH